MGKYYKFTKNSEFSGLTVPWRYKTHFKGLFLKGIKNKFHWIKNKMLNFASASKNRVLKSVYRCSYCKLRFYTAGRVNWLISNVITSDGFKKKKNLKYTSYQTTVISETTHCTDYIGHRYFDDIRVDFFMTNYYYQLPLLFFRTQLGRVRESDYQLISRTYTWTPSRWCHPVHINDVTRARRMFVH